jgi:UDP-2,4-diacetamido-2,4,6-trideoxy-beta-L-altropyranose hydrolase
MPTKTLLIRADANAEIGIGHVMRCVALAQAWRESGGNVIFALANGPKELEARICSEGLNVVRLSAKLGSLEDAAETTALCVRCGAHWIVVDGYHFPSDYFGNLRTNVSRLLLMDDDERSASRKCDIILNADPHASEAMYAQRSEQTRLLLGPRYALLRQEFLDFPKGHPSIPEQARKLLITFGGGDSHNVTLQVLGALQRLTDLELDIDVVVGATNPHRASLEEALAKSSQVARLLLNVDSMPKLMAGAELAISAGGGTCYELAFMKVPMFLITMAKNHEQAVKTFGQKIAAFSAGWFSTLKSDSLASSIRSVIFDQKFRKELVENANRMVDGRGAKRVVETMFEMSRRDRGVTI